MLVFTGLFRSGNLTLSNAVASVIWTPTCLRTSPVAAIQYYLAVHGTTPGPPFVWADGSSFTALQVWVFPAIFSHFTRYSFSCDGGFIRDWRLLLGKVSPMVTFFQPF
jgi:hypothetical protein